MHVTISKVQSLINYASILLRIKYVWSYAKCFFNSSLIKPSFLLVRIWDVFDTLVLGLKEKNIYSIEEYGGDFYCFDSQTGMKHPLYDFGGSHRLLGVYNGIVYVTKKD